MIKEIGLEEYIEYSYTEFGKYVNNHRVFPLITDGLKPSYRRPIYALWSMKDQDQKTPLVVGETLKYHPHGNVSIENTIAKLCQHGLFIGKGNWGSSSILGDDLGHAAPRYTSLRMNPKLRKLINAVGNQVPRNDNDVEEDYRCMDFIPTPIPLSLSFPQDTFGMGIGTRTEVPSFSYESLYEAYIHNDPKLLRHSTDIKINYNESELDKLWTTGYGRMVYEYDIEVQHRRVLIKGDPQLFPLNFYGKSPDALIFQEHKNQGRIIVDDISDRENPGLVSVELARGVRVDFNWLVNYVRQVATLRKTYFIKTTDGEKVKMTSIYDWIDTTYKTYLDLLNKENQHQLNRINFRIDVYKNLPKVVTYLKEVDDNASNQKLSEELSIPRDIVNSIMSKSLNMLRRTDVTKKLEELDKIKQSIESFSSVEFISDNLL